MGSLETSTKINLDQPLVRRQSTWLTLFQYLFKRVGALVLAVVAAVYLTILIANYGGYVDTIIASDIDRAVAEMVAGGWLRGVPEDELMATVEQTVASMKDAAGLNDPFFLRAANWLVDGLTLNWGGPEGSTWAYGFNTTRKTVTDVILDNLSRTLLVFGIANLLLFGASISIALTLNRRHGGFLDRLFVLLSPISSAPAWVYGVLLSIFLLRVFGFSSGGKFDVWPGSFRLSYVLVVLRYLLLPFVAIFLSGLFQSVYTWRSFFQVYSNEDYVEMAIAKGISKSQIDRDYILRPALPALLTSFALLLAVLWQEVIALEHFFNVQGIGWLFVRALNAYDTPMIVAIVTTFAYLLAITVFILDICYLLVDPRVRVGNQKNHRQNVRQVTRPVKQNFKRKNFSLAKKQQIPRYGRRFKVSMPRLKISNLANSIRQILSQVGETIKALRNYPSAVLGLAIIVVLLGVSVYTIVTIPYQEAIALWRGDENQWNRHPREALPTWVNLFLRDDLPPTLTFSSSEGGDAKQRVKLSGGLTDVVIPFTFDYQYGDFPQEIIVDVTAKYEERGPHVTISWVWPDGSERELTSFLPKLTDTYYLSRDDRLKRRLRSDYPHEAIFLNPDGSGERPVKGTYTLRINALLFEPDSDFDAKITILGQVYGLAGTDIQRRDMMIALLWGTPIALAFGLIAAFATSVGGMLIAALGAWYGGMVDRAVQFLTEVNLILPFFPVSLMVFILYSKSIVTILAVTVALTLFGSSVKTYRATFLQVRTSPYIEAARAYGASDLRIVIRYMVPRIVTVLVPKLIILVPSYVFLEATLAFLGVTDPSLPTWGKLVVAALSYGVHINAAHIVIAPLGLLFITGFAFAMVGLALEKVFEPKLRER